MKKLLLLLAFLSLPTIASAQLIQGQNVTVEADHDGLNTTEYRLLENGAVKTILPVTSLANSVISFAYVIPARGSWVIIVEACNEDGCTASDPTNFTSGKPKPNKPGKPRIIQALGTLFSSNKPTTLTVNF